MKIEDKASFKTHYRTHTCGDLSNEMLGKKVIVSGWIKTIRWHGKLMFIDLYDRYGQIQVVIDLEKLNKNNENVEGLKKLTKESVIQVSGKVVERIEKNPNVINGDIEIHANSIKIFSISEPLPIDLKEETTTNEDLRLKYRYLDLRRRRMQKNLMLRFQITQAVRQFLASQGFIEIETPILTKSTPEGARDFLVPSRKFPGKFYALPQSPQQFKQLLMVSGFDRYFQIARCFRDEDLRADRQLEFTQIDIEMSFVDEEDVIQLVENMLKFSFESVGIKINTPFKRMKYVDAMNLYGSDKPDLRFKLQLFDATEAFKHSSFRIFKDIVENDGVVKALNFKKGAKLSKKQIKKLENVIKENGGKGLAYVILDDDEVKGSIGKFWDEIKDKLMNMKPKPEIGDLILFVADKWQNACELMGKLRLKVFEMIKNDQELKEWYKSKGFFGKEFEFLWVVDFPLFSWSEEEQRFVSEHHPFTSPKDEFIDELIDKEKRNKWLNQLDKIISKAYDIVLNGYELGGGSIRIHDAELQKAIFEILGLNDEDIEKKFGHLIRAFQYGVPPHGGIALGLDRFVAIVANESSIREVIAFPKNKNAYSPLDDSPSEVSEEQLNELHIRIEKEE